MKHDIIKHMEQAQRHIEALNKWPGYTPPRRGVAADRRTPQEKSEEIGEIAQLQAALGAAAALAQQWLNHKLGRADDVANDA